MALLLLPPPLFLRSALAFFFLSLISCNCNFCWEARLDFFSFCFFLKAAMSIPLTARVNFCTRRVRWKEATERRETTTNNGKKKKGQPLSMGKKKRHTRGQQGRRQVVRDCTGTLTFFFCLLSTFFLWRRLQACVQANFCGFFLCSYIDLAFLEPNQNVCPSRRQHMEPCPG